MTKLQIIHLLKQNNVELRDCVYLYKIIFSFLKAIYKISLTHEELCSSLVLLLDQLEKVNAKIPEDIITRNAEIFDI